MTIAMMQLPMRMNIWKKLSDEDDPDSDCACSEMFDSDVEDSGDENSSEVESMSNSKEDTIKWTKKFSEEGSTIQ